MKKSIPQVSCFLLMLMLAACTSCAPKLTTVTNILTYPITLTDTETNFITFTDQLQPITVTTTTINVLPTTTVYTAAPYTYVPPTLEGPYLFMTDFPFSLQPSMQGLISAKFGARLSLYGYEYNLLVTNLASSAVKTLTLTVSVIDKTTGTVITEPVGTSGNGYSVCKSGFSCTWGSTTFKQGVTYLFPESSISTTPHNWGTIDNLRIEIAIVSLEFFSSIT
jgi:hypothetical protein